MDHPAGPDEGRQLLERFDRSPLTGLHLLVLCLCGIAFGFDLMEMGFGGALSAFFSAPPHQLGSAELAWLLSSVYIGAVLGTSTMGMLADRHGRRRMLVWLLLLLAVTSALAALSRSPLELTVARGLSGLALGAFPPLMVVLLTDLLPARRRGPAILLVCGFAFLGAPLGILLMRYLTPLQPYGLEPWRWVFALGTLGSAVLALALARWVPESPRWLLAQGRLAEARAVVARFEGSRALMKGLPPKAVPAAAAAPSVSAQLGGRRGFALLAALYFLAAWSTVAFPLLSGAVMIEKGVKLSDTLLYVGIATFGPTLGGLLTAGFADAIERRTALAGCAVLILLSTLAFMLSDGGLALAVTGLCVTLLAATYIPLLNLYGAEVAESGKRSSVVSGAWAFNRLGAALAPLLLLPLLKGEGPMAMFVVIAATLCLSVGVLALSPRGQASRAVS